MQENTIQNLSSIIISNESQQLKSQKSFTEPTLIQKTTFLVDSVTNLLCHEIYSGELVVQQNQTELPIKKHQIQEIVKPEIDLQEHKRKVKKFMRQQQSFMSRLKNRSNSLFQSIKKEEQNQEKRKQEQRQKTIEKRRQAIQSRLKSKSQLMMNIKKAFQDSNQKYNFVYNRIKEVRKKKFLYQAKEETFQNEYLLPKLQEERKILKNRKDRMKSINMDELVRHQKTYYLKKAEHQTNRTLTSRFTQTTHSYSPPSFVSKAYLISEAEQNMKKQYNDLKSREMQINKIKQKEFVKAVQQKHKIQNQLSKLQPIVQVPLVKQSKQRQKNKQLSRQAKNNLGNQYMKNLFYQLRKIKKRQSQKTVLIDLNKDNQTQTNNKKSDFDIQIIKQERISRIHRFRSKKIDSIFNDSTIHPIDKYQKLKNQVQKLQMILKLKKDQSEDINDRTEAADAYLDLIKAKLKILDVFQK